MFMYFKRNAWCGAWACVSACAAAVLMYVCMPPVGAQSSGNPQIVISQVYGGGGATSGSPSFNRDYVELHNNAAQTVTLSDYSLQYASAAGSSYSVLRLPTITLEAGQYYLVAVSIPSSSTTGANLSPSPDFEASSASGSLNMGASAGRVVLANGTTAFTSGSCPVTDAAQTARVVDFVAYGTTTTCAETAPTANLSNTRAAIRKNNGCQDTNHNANDFDVAAPAPRNSSSARNQCGGSTNPSNPTATGAANPSTVEQGTTTLLTVTVTPGANPPSTNIKVTVDLSSIGGAGNQAFFDDGTNGDVTAGDNVFSFNATVASNTLAGAKQLAVTVVDEQDRTATTTISLSVQSASNVTTGINQIQGNGSQSPLAGQTVTTTGIVTAINLNLESSSPSAGFFIQTPDAEKDADDNTSEGLYVFTSTAPTVKTGDAVRVRGTIVEFRNSSATSNETSTQLENVTVTVTSSDNALPAPVVLTEQLLPRDGAPAQPQLEKYENMRVTAARVLANQARNRFAEFFVVLDNSPQAFNVRRVRASRVERFKSRPFFDANYNRAMREAGISVLEQVPAEGAGKAIKRFDENPERLLVDFSATTELFNRRVQATTRFENLTGALGFAFGRFRVVAQSATILNEVAARPVPVARHDEFTVGSFNLLNFDAATNDFATRVRKASSAIRNVLRAPDIIGVVEVIDLQTLQTLASRIDSDASLEGQTPPGYDAYLFESDADGERDIDVGFLVKRARFNVTAIVQEGKTATYQNPESGAQELLNDRPPLLISGTLANSSTPVTVIVNHLRSLRGVEGNDAEGRRVRAKRQAQAEFLAKLINQRQQANAREHIISIGDFNAFEFNDGYVDVIGTIIGTPAPADRVVLASPDFVNPDLFNLVETLPRSERYSFIFEGHAQALDHIIVNQPARQATTRFAFARLNADFEEAFSTDATRPERTSDHDAPVAFFRIN